MPISDQISYVRIDEITIGASRQRSEVSAGDLTGSIKLYGILVPLIITRDNILIAGHRRLLAAREANLTHVPVRYYDTLDPIELKTIELEENIKRENLSWRDHVSAVGELHQLKLSADSSWTQERTGEILSLSQQTVGRLLTVFINLDNPDIVGADNLSHAVGILQRLAERQTAAIVEGLLRSKSDETQITENAGSIHDTNDTADNSINNNNNDFSFESSFDREFNNSISLCNNNNANSIGSDTERPTPPSRRDSIIVANFIDWSSSYSGPKFNLIHCDFPYGVHASDTTLEHYENNEKLFWNLTNALVNNIDSLLSYSAHIMFWLNFQYYELVKDNLRAIENLHVIDRPLIWVKSDSKGASPGLRGTQPRHTYEIALLAYRGNRPLTYQGTDSYSAPTVSNPIHPTQKPEPMLKHFLSMLVDQHTDFLDPTAGSGSSVRVAEELGARMSVGLEINSEFALAANAMTNRVRDLRVAARQVEIEL